MLKDLETARFEATEIALRQKEWRKTAAALLERGDVAGLSVAEMARALGRVGTNVGLA